MGGDCAQVQPAYFAILLPETAKREKKIGKKYYNFHDNWSTDKPIRTCQFFQVHVPKRLPKKN